LGILDFQVPIFGAMGVNIPGLIGQIVNFLILLFVLRAVAYKPILKMLDERAARIKDGIEAAEQARREAAEMERQYQAKMEDARRENQKIIDEAMRVADRVRTDAQEQAREQSEQFLARARAEIEQEKRQAMAELRSQIADLAVLAAGKILRRSIDPKDHTQIIEEALAEADKLKYN
jgi:F-type H+-transporting ATPase subunit b